VGLPTSRPQSRGLKTTLTLNRLIKDNDLNMIYVIGPGHGGPGIVAHSYLEGSYTEHYPAIERSRNGLQRLFRQFSWPYGIPSHVAPETPGDGQHEPEQPDHSASLGDSIMSATRIRFSVHTRSRLHVFFA
jgi:XFP N-terminal domain